MTARDDPSVSVPNGVICAGGRMEVTAADRVTGYWCELVWMTGLTGKPYTMNPASYDLARLSRHALITCPIESSLLGLRRAQHHGPVPAVPESQADGR
jgi:hypothetical protein